MESITVPGVIICETLRSIIPLELGSPTCSQITIEIPLLTNFCKYASIAWNGTPAIGIPLLFELFLLVNVIFKIFEASTASSKNNS